MLEQKQKVGAKYWVGIDLGTTNTVLAYIKHPHPNAQIQVLPLQQWVGPHQSQALPALPSIQYQYASTDEKPSTALFAGQTELVQAFPKTLWGPWGLSLGSQTQGRLIHSAKSWLSLETDVNQQATLPINPASDVYPVSPVAASASYLQYLRLVWDHQFPASLLKDQIVIITIPASFGQTARQQTLLAAQQAGLPRVQFIEEPLAAFYYWYWRQATGASESSESSRMMQMLSQACTVLVCDIGGGTTDFSIIQSSPLTQSHLPTLSRIAVGDHLLLGGDNVDHLLMRVLQGYYLQHQPKGKRLPRSVQAQLLLHCRSLKEQALQSQGPEVLPASITHSGSQLLQKTWRYDWPTEEIRTLVLEGFFPKVAMEEPLLTSTNVLGSWGLPYASDPAITRQLAAFLRHHDVKIDAVLFNGGLLQSELLQQRLLEQLTAWYGQTPVVLENPQLAHSVALGAVSWQWFANQQQFAVVESNIARSYWLQVGVNDQHAVPQAVCIIPQGRLQEAWQTLEDRHFELTLNQQVVFKVWSSCYLAKARLGDMRSFDLTQFSLLPEMQAHLLTENNVKKVTVKLAACVNMLGILQLKCIAETLKDDQGHPAEWFFEFDKAKKKPRGADCKQFAELFYQKELSKIKQIRGALEGDYGPWETWSFTTMRQWSDALLRMPKVRFKSAEHERVWLQLLGWCLRPGLGDEQDVERLQTIQALFSQGVHYPKVTANWLTWWTCWRRIAPGLPAHFQQTCFESVEKWFDANSWRSKQLQKARQTHGFAELIRFVASLEYLPVERRILIGGQISMHLTKIPAFLDSLIWALGRLGARQLISGEALPRASVSSWVESLLRLNWRKTPNAGLAAAMIVDECFLTEVRERLIQMKAPNHWQNLLSHEADVLSHTAGAAQYTQLLLGESLPLGLTEA